MLKLSKKADYGLIALRHLAKQRRSNALSTKEIAQAYGIPSELLAKVLQKLARNGLVLSQHGAEGGYILAREPATVTAFDVVRALDGPLLITSCNTARGECNQALKCTVRQPLSKVNDVIVQALMSVTLANLSDDSPSLVKLGSTI